MSRWLQRPWSNWFWCRHLREIAGVNWPRSAKSQTVVTTPIVVAAGGEAIRGNLSAIWDNLSEVVPDRGPETKKSIEFAWFGTNPIVFFKKKDEKETGGKSAKKSWGKEFFGAYFKTPKCGHYLKRKSPPLLPLYNFASFRISKKSPFIQLDPKTQVKYTDIKKKSR